MSIQRPSVSTPKSDHVILADSGTPDFEARWDEWLARGLAHDRAVRKRFTIAVLVLVPLAISASIAYRVLYP
jgi:hypothetical protein